MTPCNFLRPAYEAISAIVFIVAAFALLNVPHIFLLSPDLGAGLGAFFFIVGSWRAWQVIDVLVNRANLKRLPIFAITPDELPVSKDGALFVGRGFEWKNKHTQLLYDARLAMKLLDNGPITRLAQTININFRRKQKMPWLVNFLEMLFPLPREGDSLLHGVGAIEEEDIHLEEQTRKQGHTLVFGVPGAGKTRLLENFSSQDIRRGDGAVIVFDPKGDRDILFRMFYECKKAGRLNDFRVFHLGFPEISNRYNPIGSYTRITEIASRIVEQLPAGGDAQAFKNFVWLYVNSIAKAMEFLNEIPCYETLNKYANRYEELFNRVALKILKEKGITEYNWRTKFQDLFNYHPIKTPTKDAIGLNKALAARNRSSAALHKLLYHFDYIKHDVITDLLSTLTKDASYHGKLIGSLSPVLSRMCTNPIKELVNPDYENLGDRRKIFDWRSVINSKGVVYVALNSLTDLEVAQSIGMAMFSDLVATVGQIYTENQASTIAVNPDFKARTIPIYIHADEFNTTLGAAFVPLINQGRGAGVNMVCYTQTPEDIEARVEKSAKADQISGNFRNLILMRVASPNLEKLLKSKIAKVPLATKDLKISIADQDDVSGFGASVTKSIKQQSVNIIEASDIGKLGVGEAFAFIGGGKLIKIRMPLPIASKEINEINMDTIARELLK